MSTWADKFFEVETGEFVQIIHTGEGHWHVVSTIGMQHNNVNEFDSMYCYYPEHNKVQIANLLMTKITTIQLHYNNVQMQSGQADCGLFAIAFATALLNGLHPKVHSFNQSLIRSHLFNCFEKREMETSPILKERRVNNKVKRTEQLNLYCSCRRKRKSRRRPQQYLSSRRRPQQHLSSRCRPQQHLSKFLCISPAQRAKQVSPSILC